jgi:hypothetical protein
MAGADLFLATRLAHVTTRWRPTLATQRYHALAMRIVIAIAISVIDPL